MVGQKSLSYRRLLKDKMLKFTYLRGLTFERVTTLMSSGIKSRCNKEDLFSVATFNVRGLRNHVKQEALSRDIDKYKIDIFCLQETKKNRTFWQNYATWKQINNNTIEQSTLWQSFHFKQKMEKFNTWILEDFWQTLCTTTKNRQIKK